jgi:hypothetical protein
MNAASIVFADGASWWPLAASMRIAFVSSFARSLASISFGTMSTAVPLPALAVRAMSAAKIRT